MENKVIKSSNLENTNNEEEVIQSNSSMSDTSLNVNQDEEANGIAIEIF